MMKKIYLLFVCALSSFAVFSQPIFIQDSLLIEGNYRYFHYKKPSSETKNVSLVFVMHGSGGNGLQMTQRAASVAAVSDQENFIAVFPSGYKNFWNECRKAAPSETNLQDINEQGFFLSMINYFHSKYKINRKNVFAIGTSGGGHMAYKLALTMPTYFKAVTAIIANLPDSTNMDCTESKKPMNIMIVNGTEDKTNPYMGGDVNLASGNFGRVMSTERSFTYWAALAGYTGKPAFETLPDNDPKDGKTIERYSYSGKNKEVVLLKVIGGKHDYPGDIDVHLYAWDFFKHIMHK
jgi:polyhydroxybutyrate depolymerase